LSGETEVLGENVPQRHFVHHKSHLTRPGIEPGPPWWEASGLPLELWRGPGTELRAQDCDNVLPGQGQGAVTEEYGAMVE
jgi:hypothetical protein